MAEVGQTPPKRTTTSKHLSLKAKQAPTKSAHTTASAQTTAALAHEFRVNQIELKRKNEELRRSKTELRVARDRYEQLYDVAPVGHLTLNR